MNDMLIRVMSLRRPIVIDMCSENPPQQYRVGEEAQLSYLLMGFSGGMIHIYNLQGPPLEPRVCGG